MEEKVIDAASLRARRAALGITRETLAERLALPLHTLRNWEQGVRAIPFPVLLDLALSQIENEKSPPEPLDIDTPMGYYRDREEGAEMTGSSSWITKHRRLAIYIRDRFVCQYCGCDLKDASPREMGLDHLEDLVAGGGHRGANNASDNLVTACRRCNSQRGAKAWREYATGGAIHRIEATRHLPLNIELAKAIIAGQATWADR